MVIKVNQVKVLLSLLASVAIWKSVRWKVDAPPHYSWKVYLKWNQRLIPEKILLFSYADDLTAGPVGRRCGIAELRRRLSRGRGQSRSVPLWKPMWLELCTPCNDSLIWASQSPPALSGLNGAASWSVTSCDLSERLSALRGHCCRFPVAPYHNQVRKKAKSIFLCIVHS